MIVPPGYKVQKEEDKNVDFGDTYVPQQFWLTGYPLADGGPGDAQPAPTVTDSALLAPFCVGQLHEVPDDLSLFPGQAPARTAGEMRPLCDAKLVTLRDGQHPAADFHLFTEAPVAGHIYGMVLDDTTNEFDPNAPTFGEKYAVPFIGVAIRDWQGREITRTYTDQYGMYNALVPSSYTANPPQPSGVSPSILSACINPPTMPGPAGRWWRTRTSRSSTATSATRCSTWRARRRTWIRPWCRPAPSPATGRSRSTPSSRTGRRSSRR